jgi:NTE family protein
VRYGSRTLLDGAVVNPLPVAPTLEDATDLTVAVGLSGPAETSAPPEADKLLRGDSGYRARILKFVESVRPERRPKEASRGLLDVAFTSMQVMQDTIAELRLSAFSPDVMIEIPRNACGFFEFWRAEELIAMGRDRAALEFARADT